MNPVLLDPWSDAQVIAQRLARHDARLVVVVGAEAWCKTCRTFRPAFDALASAAGVAADVWLWLDLDDHAEFLGDFIPDSLPLLLSYRGQRLTHAVVPTVITQAWLSQTLAEASRIEHGDLPDLRGRLMSSDWAL